MKKLLAILAAAAFVVGCSSDKEPVDNDSEMVVVKHCGDSGVKKHHKKKMASMSSSKFGG